MNNPWLVECDKNKFKNDWMIVYSTAKTQNSKMTMQLLQLMQTNANSHWRLPMQRDAVRQSVRVVVYIGVIFQFIVVFWALIILFTWLCKFILFSYSLNVRYKLSLIYLWSSSLHSNDSPKISALFLLFTRKIRFQEVSKQTTKSNIECLEQTLN